MARCLACDAEIPAQTGRGPRRKYCPDCRPSSARERTRLRERARKRRAQIREAATPLSRIDYEDCIVCGKLFVLRPDRMNRVKVRKVCRDPDCERKRDTEVRARYQRPPLSDAARTRLYANNRNRDHMRRAGESDITTEELAAMRKRARKCPLCGVYMTNKAGLPNSKQVDHIVPINQGGTHTHGNVRIICRTCNLRRPKDGSDFEGQATLWAEVPSVVSRRRVMCGNGLHPWIPANIKTDKDGSKHCAPCRKAADRKRWGSPGPRQCGCGASFEAPGRQFMCPACLDVAGRKAAELHASGLTWKQVAAEIGYGSDQAARHAAKRAGYQWEPANRGEPKRQPDCPDCGKPKRLTATECPACRTEKAWRAVELRRGGATLRAIADQIGYGHVTRVTNLMKTVAAATDPSPGRPAKHS